MLATSIKLPTSEEMKNLSLADIAIAAGLADEFRDRLREYVHIDSYCVPIHLLTKMTAIILSYLTERI